jgi:hypothetical protein
MEHTVMLTWENDGIHATVPGMPKCQAKSETRSRVLSLIRDNIAETLRKSEIVRIDIPENAEEGETDWRAYGYGAFKDDPNWGEIFDEIEKNRDLSLTGTDE